MKWYIKLLIVLLVVVFSPVILLGIVIAALAYLFELPRHIKEYKNSQYYNDFHLPFAGDRLYSPEYRFYNSIKNRGLQVAYTRQESNGFEYFIFNDTLFLFPDFDQIDYDEDQAIWQVDYDGDWEDLENVFMRIVSKIDKDAPELPLKLLVERKMFPLMDLNNVSIPECIFLTRNYETVFDNEDSLLKLRVPTNSQELYDMMLATPNLCGNFRIVEGGNIHWDLYKNIQIDIGVDLGDCYFSINKKLNGNIISGITHWHPTNFEIYDDVCEIGMPGKVLVIRRFMSGASVLYMGDEGNCPYSPDKKSLFGKLYYLKSD